jgi:hypothetical protein
LHPQEAPEAVKEPLLGRVIGCVERLLDISLFGRDRPDR